MTHHSDQYWMTRALELANRAAAAGEVPVGALVVRDDLVLGEAWNCPIHSCDPTNHAEIAALRRACEAQRNYRLPGSTLYVTIEPCTMCLGAMVHARVERLVFGAREPRAGAVVSQLQLLDRSVYNHKLSWSEGILAQQCSETMRAFFRARR